MMFKFPINLLPISCQNYFQKVETIHNKSTRNSLCNDSYFLPRYNSEDFNKVLDTKEQEFGIAILSKLESLHLIYLKKKHYKN